MMVMRRKLDSGDPPSRFVATANREIGLVRGGKLAYLWIGNADSPTFCFATLSGATNLRKLAKAILREVGDD